MEKNIELKVMRCPTCGGTLNVGKGEDTVECVYCGNTVTPMLITESSQDGGLPGGASIKIDGIKTASSALAYLELFFEEFDWNAFTFGSGITVPELERIADTLKTTSADNPETWVFCAKIALTPYLNKCGNCAGLIDRLIEAYRKNDPDAYALFDTYRRLSVYLRAAESGVREKAQKYVALAEKYGASSDALSALREQISALDESAALKSYANITDIPAVREYDSEKDARIEKALAEKGIDAKATYEKAVAQLEADKPAEALSLFRTLDNYADAARQAEELNHLFVIDRVIEVGSRRFLLQGRAGSSTLALFPTEDGKVQKEAVTDGIGDFLCVYAGLFFYLNSLHKLCVLDVKTKENRVLSDRSFTSEDGTLSDDQEAYYLFTLNSGSGALCKITLKDQTVTEVATGIDEVLDCTLPYVMYTSIKTEAAPKNTATQTNAAAPATASAAKKVTVTCVANVETGEVTELGKGKIEPEGYIDDRVVFTLLSPDAKNRLLYIRLLRGSEAGATLLERNIYAVNKIFSGKIYYSVGNAASQALISINPDGTDRREISLHIKNLLMERGGWLYFVRSTSYNSVMFRSRPDGTQEKVICRNVESFVEENGGYLYYIDTHNDLLRVRMDGSGQQMLCSKVKKVICVRDDSIIYTAYDNARAEETLSIYATDFYGRGKRKLAYDVLEAKKYDNDTVYFTVKAPNATSSADRVLNSISCDTFETEKLLRYRIYTPAPPAPQKSGCYVATCVYGSYDCPEVWTLRRYRDDILAKTPFGRLFIMLYYAVSPTAVRLFGDTRWFRFIWRARLDRLVRKLSARGIENTPYEDKRW